MHSPNLDKFLKNVHFFWMMMVTICFTITVSAQTTGNFKLLNCKILQVHPLYRELNFAFNYIKYLAFCRDKICLIDYFDFEKGNYGTVFHAKVLLQGKNEWRGNNNTKNSNNNERLFLGVLIEVYFLFTRITYILIVMYKASYPPISL